MKQQIMIAARSTFSGCLLIPCRGAVPEREAHSDENGQVTWRI